MKASTDPSLADLMSPDESTTAGTAGEKSSPSTSKWGNVAAPEAAQAPAVGTQRTRTKPAKKAATPKPGAKKPQVKGYKKPKKEPKRGAMYYAMPWNLAREIRLLGFSFSVKRAVTVYGLILGLMIGVGMMFKLTPLAILPLIIAGLWFSPTLVRNVYKDKFERQRFSDVNVYIEQMLYAFKNSQKILTAMEDVRVLFPLGSAMRKAIDNAIAGIIDPTPTPGYASSELRALEEFEARYPNDYVRSLHRFMLKVESIGGNFDSSIDLLLGNRSMWENRVHRLQAQRREKRSQILGSLVASVLLCLLMLYILPEDVDISSMLPVQIANVLIVIVFVRIYQAADTKLSSDLLRSQSYGDDEKLLAAYERYVGYNAKKGFKSSLVFAIIPVVIIIGGLLAGNSYVLAAGVVILPLMLFQHVVGHKLLGKRLRREISVAFPQWLMELALLLQADNVQVAIFKTAETALPVMQPELKIMREKLVKNPAANEPFMEFFEIFEMHEITTSMQMLYSLSIGGGGDADEQVANIVKRNNIILDRAEQAQNDNSLSSLYTLFLLPVLLGGVVLMVDMTAFLMTFVTNLGL